MQAALKMPNRAPHVEAANLDELLTMYIQEKSAGVKWETMRNYKLRLEWFRRFWTEYGPKNNHLLTPQAFRDYDQWLQTDFRSKYDRPASGDALHRASQQIKQFCQWLYTAQCINFPIDGWVIEHNPARNTQFWPTLAQNQQIFDTLSAEPTRLRDMAGFAFLLATGARRIEVSGAKIENFHFNTSVSNLRLGDDHAGYCHLAITKGGKPRDVWFGKAAGLLVKVWIRASGNDSGPLLGLLDDGVAHIIRRASKRCGLPELSCHSGRRAFVDHWATVHSGDGLAYQALKLQLGHSLFGRMDVTAAAYLNHRNPAKVKELLQKYHTSPMDEIKVDWAKLPVHTAE